MTWYDKDDCKELERAILDFYIHSFVHVFHRLLIPPAVLPADWP